MRLTSDNAPVKKEMVVGSGVRFLSVDPRTALADIFRVSTPHTDNMVDTFTDAAVRCERLQIKTPTAREELQRVHQID